MGSEFGDYVCTSLSYTSRAFDSTRYHNNFKAGAHSLAQLTPSEVAAMRQYAGYANSDAPKVYPDGTTNSAASESKRILECARACYGKQINNRLIVSFGVVPGTGRCYCDTQPKNVGTLVATNTGNTQTQYYTFDLKLKCDIPNLDHWPYVCPRHHSRYNHQCVKCLEGSDRGSYDSILTSASTWCSCKAGYTENLIKTASPTNSPTMSLCTGDCDGTECAHNEGTCFQDPDKEVPGCRYDSNAKTRLDQDRTDDFCSPIGSVGGQISCSECPNGKYQTQTGQASCNSCRSSCSAGEYEKNPCEKDQDRVCSSVSAECGLGKYQSSIPSSTSDRICTTCESGKYNNDYNQNTCKTCLTHSNGCNGQYHGICKNTYKLKLNALSFSGVCESCAGPSNGLACGGCSVGTFRPLDSTETSWFGNEHFGYDPNYDVKPDGSAISNHEKYSGMYSGCQANPGTSVYPDGTKICDATPAQRIEECARACYGQVFDGIGTKGFIVIPYRDEGPAEASGQNYGRCYCAVKFIDSSAVAVGASGSKYYQYDFITNGACETCPTGQYQDQADQVGCLACSPECSTGRVKIRNCAPEHDLTCADPVCPAGKYQSTPPSMDGTIERECTPCDAGRYQSTPDKTSCIGCPTGKYSLGGTAGCTDCTAGKYSATFAASSAASCLDCAAGKYSSSTAANTESACKNCDAEQTSTAGSIECVECGISSYTTPDGICRACPSGWVPATDSCTECGAGTKAEGKNCLDCGAGTYSTAGASSCTDCAAGKYNSFVKRSSCTNCPNGQYQTQTGQITCKTCPNGRHSSNTLPSTECSSCAKGKHDHDRKPETPCTDCGSNSYQDQTGQSSCKSCTSCTMHQQFIVVACEKDQNRVCDNIIDCLAGQYQTEAPTITSNRKCSSCPNGKYQEQMNKESCKFCEAGKEFTTKSTVCTDCASGKFQFLWNALSVSCQDCLVGQYQTEKGQASCLDCDAGKYQTEKGQVSCTSCQNGKYQTQLGQTSCTSCTTCTSTQTVETECSATTNRACGTWCKPGEKQTKAATNEDGSDRECGLCEAGKYQDGANHEFSVCKTCSPGSVTDKLANLGSKSCTACPAGQYSSGSTSACQNCGAGSYTNTLINNGASSCTACGVGTYSDDSIKACTACNAGSIAEMGEGSGVVNSKATTCTECATGQYSGQSTVACAVCAAGQFSDKGASECSQCPVGFYQDQSGSAECIQCSNGKYQDKAGKTDCLTCSWGQYTVSKELACQTCPEGKFQELAVAIEYNCKFCAVGTEFIQKFTSCDNCAAGKYQDKNNEASVTCKFCATGTEFDTPTTTCKNCDDGKYQDKNNQASVTCKFCAVGTGFDTIATACKDCVPGQYQDQSSVAGINCKACQVGRYVDIAKQAACIDCAPNTYADTISQPICKQCAIGKFVSAPGSDTASDCDWQRCPYRSGKTANIFNCFCDAAQQNICTNELPTCNENGQCSERQCANVVGTIITDKICKCGDSQDKCSVGEFCFDPDIENQIVCGVFGKPDCGCSNKRQFTCDFLNEQDEYPDRDPAAQIIQVQSCSCGNTVCFKDDYCNSEFSLCSSTPSQKCNYIDGKVVNPSACLCGDESCFDNGYYCDVERPENKCFKKLCAEYSDIDQLCDRPGYGNGVLPGDPQCANTWCDLDDFNVCCKPCPNGNEVINGKCRRKCIGVACTGDYSDPLLSINYQSLDYTGYCTSSICDQTIDVPQCCWKKKFCSEMTSDFCYLTKYTGNINGQVACDDFQCTPEKCCETRECSCLNGVAAQGRLCPIADQPFCVQCDPNFWLSNKMCKPVTRCLESEYQRLNYTAFSDRVCETIEPECQPNSYESKTPSRKEEMYIENRECTLLTECSDDEYEKTPPEQNKNRECAPFSKCNASQYQIKAGSGTSDIECAQVSPECGTNEYEESPPSPNTDRICKPISAICSFPDKYEESPPNATSDRICKPVETCSLDIEYRQAIATPTSNTKCVTRRECSDQEYELNSGDITHDRTCNPLTVCTNREFESTPPETTKDRKCTLLKRCMPDEYEIIAATKVTDRECQKCVTDGCIGCTITTDCYYNPDSKIHSQSACSGNTCTIINETFTGSLKSDEWFRTSLTVDGIDTITPDHVSSSVFYIKPEDIDKQITIGASLYNIIQDCKYERKWFDCSNMCGEGNQLGVRGKLIRPALHGGLTCESIPKTITKKCIGILCPIHCAVVWDAEFEACTAPCGRKGLKYKKYNITQQPKYKGEECPSFEAAECISDPPEGFCDCDLNKKDACGICGGRGLTCAGCDGVPNSGKIKDHCGKCVDPKDACSLQSIQHDRETRSKRSKTLKIVVPVATGSTLFVVVMAIIIGLCCQESKEFLKKKARSAERNTNIP